MRESDRFSSLESSSERGPLPRLQEEGRTPIGDKSRGRALLIATAAMVVIADQSSKAWVVANLDPGERIPLIGDLFGIRMSTNSGGAFGMFPNAPLVFFTLSVAIVCFVAVWAWREPQNVVALGMVLGGGLGNLIDRITRPPGPMRGGVVDFLDLSFWPTFNVADSAIVIGVMLLFLLALRK
jgi:signal peptidase II